MNRCLIVVSILINTAAFSMNIKEVRSSNPTGVIKHQILASHGTAHIIEVIGDSKPVTPEGYKQFQKFLKPLLNHHDATVLFGATGRAKPAQPPVGGVNEAILDMARHDKHFAHRVAGNLVEQQLDLTKKGAIFTNPSIERFYLFKRDDKKPSQFGDDIDFSDALADEIWVGMGGPQSSMQVVNVLSRDVPLRMLFGARIRHPEDQKYLSTSELFWLLKRVKIWQYDKRAAQHIFETICRLKPMTPVTNAELDAKTKAPLIQKLEEQLFQNERYKHLISTEIEFVFADPKQDKAYLESFYQHIPKIG